MGGYIPNPDYRRSDDALFFWGYSENGIIYGIFVGKDPLNNGRFLAIDTGGLPIREYRRLSGDSISTFTPDMLKGQIAFVLFYSSGKTKVHLFEQTGDIMELLVVTNEVSTLPLQIVPEGSPKATADHGKYNSEGMKAICGGLSLNINKFDIGPNLTNINLTGNVKGNLKRFIIDSLKSPEEDLIELNSEVDLHMHAGNKVCLELKTTIEFSSNIQGPKY
jgi:hypothetical protein